MCDKDYEKASLSKYSISGEMPIALFGDNKSCILISMHQCISALVDIDVSAYE